MSPDVSTYVNWETYRRILGACDLLARKEGKAVTPYKFVQRAIMKALREGLKPTLNVCSVDDHNADY